MRDGDLLGGRYRLLGQIAVGGMGEVWRADDETLGRQVAVKVLKAEYAEDPTFLERFRAEARNTAMLSHSGIATVYDYGEVALEGGYGSSSYLVMELVPGQPLSALLAAEAPLAPDRVMNIVGQAALALQAAHEAGVVHRDIKPGNLLVTADDTVKVTDFGIARAADAVPLTRTGTVLGTAFYLSPEQAAGDEVGPASDIYSLGIVAYECLTGRRPFPGSNPVAVALAHQREQAPPLPPQIPLQVRELVERAMAKNPPDRPPTAGDFGRAALALRDGLQGTRPMPAMGMPPTSRLAGTRPAGTAVLPRTGPPPPRRPPPGPVGPPPRRRRGLRAPLVGLVLLALLVGGFALVRSITGGTPVPNVKGQQYTAASQILVRAGFTVRVNGSRDGVVQSQDPAGGDKAKKSSAVTLTFGSQAVQPAKTTINADDYVGRRLADVRSELTGLGFGVSLSGSTSADATVTGISPTGAVTNGSVISVTAHLRQTATPTPTRTFSTTSPPTPSVTRSSASSGSGSGNSNSSGTGNGAGTGNSGNGSSNGNSGGNGNGVLKNPLPGTGNSGNG
jgi:hypothetical protein